MKKILLITSVVALNFLTGCYSTDNKNADEPYPATDTNRPMEHIGKPDSISPGVSSPNGDIH